MHTGNHKVVYLSKHDYCESEAGDKNCCGIIEQQCCDTGNSSGSSEKIIMNHEDCCVNEQNYLKGDSYYYKPDKREFNINFYATSLYFYSVRSFFTDLISKTSEFNPPLLVTSPDFLYQTGKLLL